MQELLGSDLAHPTDAIYGRLPHSLALVAHVAQDCGQELRHVVQERVLCGELRREIKK